MAKNVPGMDVRTMCSTAAISTRMMEVSLRQEIAAPAAVVTYTPSMQILIAASFDQATLLAGKFVHLSRARNLCLKSMFSIFAFLARAMCFFAFIAAIVGFNPA